MNETEPTLPPPVPISTTEARYLAFRSGIDAEPGFFEKIQFVRGPDSASGPMQRHAERQDAKRGGKHGR